MTNPEGEEATMERGERLSEGKTKIVYAHPLDPALAIMVQKDAISAGDGARRNEIEGKGALSGRTAANVFALLNRAGIVTHLVQPLGDSEMLVRRCRMIPLEVVMRRLATGSYLRRNPDTPEGTCFDPVLVEFFLKDDARHDPQVQPDEIASDGIATAEDVTAMTDTGRAVFAVLERAWADHGIELADLKIEFGHTTDGQLIVADMIDNDSWRLWPAGDKAQMLDKQIYRNMQTVTAEGLATVKHKYAEVAALTDRWAEIMPSIDYIS
jgi:phosphoribosylaminoimidazole-succinocarboxamide synthase